MTGAPRLLVTGFGPFPGAPENPTERLVRRARGGAGGGVRRERVSCGGAQDRISRVVGGA